MAFEIKSGINISHWLSQNDNRGNERSKRFTIEDILKVTDNGFDHVRIPVDEVQLWFDDGTVDNAAFDMLNEGIYRCKKQNLRVIVDMHILRSHYFNDTKQPALYTDQNELDHFCSLWTQIYNHLKEWDIDTLALEILNEPKAEHNADWNRVSSKVFSTIRNLDNSRTIILGSNWYCKSDTFDALQVPDDKNQLLTFHFYDPMIITHHKAVWTNIGAYSGEIRYPGIPIDSTIVDKLQNPLKSHIQKENVYTDRKVILQKLEQPVNVRDKSGINVFCGEFGCIRYTPHDIKCRWYRDVISVFNELHIPYTHWDLKGDFGILDGSKESAEIIKILTNK